jgi:hypothetical protein
MTTAKSAVRVVQLVKIETLVNRSVELGSVLGKTAQ